MVSDAQKEATKRYEKKISTFIFKLRKDKDADVIKKLRSEPSITGYIRELVRRDIGSPE